MANAVITVSGADNENLAVTDSTRVHAGLSLNFSSVGNLPAFTIVLPAGGWLVTLRRDADTVVGHEVTLTGPGSPSTAITGHIVSWTSPVAGTIGVTVTDAAENLLFADSWTVRMSSPAAPGTVTLACTNRGSVLTAEADPVVTCEPVTPALSGAATSWKDGDLITLSATAARNTVPATTTSPCGGPGNLFAWSEHPDNSVASSPTSPTSTPDTGVTPATCRVKAQVPISGVNANTTLKYVFTATIGDFTSSCITTVPVTSRTRYTLIALDHSHNMVWNAANKQWDDGLAAAHLWLDLVNAFRHDPAANADDRVGILTFDDPLVGFRGATPSPTIGVKWPAANAMQALSGIDTMPAITIPAPTAGQTPLGDAVIAALDKLEATGVCRPDYRYDLVVMSDGNENAGTVIVGTQPAAVPGTPGATLGATLYDGHRSIFDFGANGNIHLYAIALGEPTPPAGVPPVNTAVLDALVAPLAAGGSARYTLQSHVRELFAAGFGEMASRSLNAAQQAVLPDLPALSAAAGYTAQPDPAFVAGKAAYFLLPAAEQKLAVLLAWSGAGNTLQLTSRPQGSGAAFTAPAGLLVKARTNHGVAAITFPAGGSAATEWRVQMMNGGVAANIAVGDVFAARDLRTKVDVAFDRAAYFTGDAVVVNARIRCGGRPVLGARITADVIGPGGERISPPFTDGTNRLRDDALSGDRAARDGDYANTFRPANPGVHTIRLTAAGTTPDGGAFLDVVARTRHVTAAVQPDQSKLTTTVLAKAPAGMRAVEVRLDPRDVRGQPLGRGPDGDVEFLATAGAFQGAPVTHRDGTVTQVLFFPADQSPQVTVRLQGRFIAPQRVASGPAGRQPAARPDARQAHDQPRVSTIEDVLVRTVAFVRAVVSELRGGKRPPP